MCEEKCFPFDLAAANASYCAGSIPKYEWVVLLWPVALRKLTCK